MDNPPAPSATADEKRTEDSFYKLTASLMLPELRTNGLTIKDESAFACDYGK